MASFIGYYYFMQTFMPLCMTLNCTLTTVPVITLAACSFAVGQAWTTSTFRSHVICVKLWISIPIQVSTDDWLALSWLANVGWSLILASYHHVLQMFSTAARFVRAHLEFSIPWDKTVISAVSKAWLMSPLHCVLNWEVFFTLILK